MTVRIVAETLPPEAAYAVATLRRLQILCRERSRRIAAGDGTGALDITDTIASITAALTRAQLEHVLLLAMPLTSYTPGEAR